MKKILKSIIIALGISLHMCTPFLIFGLYIIDYIDFERGFSALALLIVLGILLIITKNRWVGQL